MFKNTTITMRLMAGFGAVIAMLVIVVGLALAYLNSLTTQIDVLATNRVPQVIAVGKWEASVLRTARHMQTVFVLTEPGEVQMELKAIRDNREEQAALFSQIKGRAVSAESQALVERVDQARKAYQQAETEFVRDAEAGRIDDAKVTLLVKTRGAQGAYIDSISKLGAFFSEDCKQIVWRASRPVGKELEDYKALLARGLVRPTKLELWVANADGSNPRPFTYLGAASFAPYFFPDGRRILKLMDGKSGYLSQSDLPLYFGLGDADRASSSEVVWPSGRRQALPGPHPAGRAVEVVEP